MSIEDRFYRFLPIYSELPVYVKYMVGNVYRSIPLSIRYGHRYEVFCDLANKERKWTREQAGTYQLGMLKKLVSYAHQYVPYYNKSFQAINHNIKSFDDFYKLPFFGKEQLRNSADLLLSKKYNKHDLITLSTGGSTGNPLLLYYEKGIVRTKEFAYMNDQWNRIGYKFGDKMAVFRSALVRGRHNAKLWDYDPIKNRWVCSSYDLTLKYLPKIVEHLRKIKPKYLHVYPSALTMLANYMKFKNEAPISSVKGILSGSENTFPSQIKLFKDVFKCPVFRWYGLGEISALAGSCEFSTDYHCYNSYSYVELIDDYGNHVTEIGKKGEIVGTTFDNYAMPLIRYRTGDYAIYGGNKCDKCGRVGILFKEIEGRVQEKIVDKEGNIHSLGPYLFGIHEKDWSNISAIQFIQEKKGKIKILAVSSKLDPHNAKEYVCDLFAKRFKNNFDIKVIITDKTEKTKAGKHKYLIQKLDLKYFYGKA